MAENKSNFGFYTLMLGILTLGGWFVLKAQGKTVSDVIKPIKNILPTKLQTHTPTSSGSGNIGTGQYLDAKRSDKCIKNKGCNSFLNHLNNEMQFKQAHIEYKPFEYGAGVFMYDINNNLYFFEVKEGLWVYHKVPSYFVINDTTGVIIDNSFKITDELKYVKKGCDAKVYTNGSLVFDCKKENIKSGGGSSAKDMKCSEQCSQLPNEEKIQECMYKCMGVGLGTNIAVYHHGIGNYKTNKDFWSK